jgi:hypothetical protein
MGGRRTFSEPDKPPVATANFAKLYAPHIAEQRRVATAGRADEGFFGIFH